LHRLLTEQAGGRESPHPRQKLIECALPRGGDLRTGAKTGYDSLEGDSIESRVVEHEASEHRNADCDQIGNGIVGLAQLGDAVGEELERSLRECIDAASASEPTAARKE